METIPDKIVPTVTTNTLPGGWNLPVGCQISGSSPNVGITFFTPVPTTAQLEAGFGGAAASPWGTTSVALSAATSATLAAALSAYSPQAAVQAAAAYAFWAAYGLFVSAGGA